MSQAPRRIGAHVRVKICGITSAEDARAAESAGADAVGFMFASTSRRLVTAEQAAAIGAALGPFITKVGVFVDATLTEVQEVVRVVGLDAVQLHGHETAEYALALRSQVKVIKAVSFERGLTPQSLAGFPADALLLDGAVPGSGRRFEWGDAGAWRALPKLVLAGGLNPANVADGVRALAPYAVDVSSGVESAPGVKSAELMARFVAAARSAA
jgi:phosphoribosylanthranilate isomerase